MVFGCAADLGAAFLRAVLRAGVRLAFTFVLARLVLVRLVFARFVLARLVFFALVADFLRGFRATIASRSRHKCHREHRA